jgi:antirestriction protein ArdC
LLGLQDDYNYPFWGTFNQIRNLGGKVHKGEKSREIVFSEYVIRNKQSRRKITFEDYKKLSKREQDYYTMFRLLKIHRVFNIDQTEDINLNSLGIDQKINDSISECEDLLNSYKDKPSFHFRNSQPCYIPSLDKIQMPDINAYESNAEFYGTLFHELVHSVGHPKRLNREGLKSNASFGSKTYSFEELIAEIGACFLRTKCGIESKSIDNSVAYINSWIKVLENDNTFIFKAASEAQKAFNFILNKEALLSLFTSRGKTYCNKYWLHISKMT